VLLFEGTAPAAGSKGFWPLAGEGCRQSGVMACLFEWA